jgi:hypothetical protein
MGIKETKKITVRLITPQELNFISMLYDLVSKSKQTAKFNRMIIRVRPYSSLTSRF